MARPTFSGSNRSFAALAGLLLLCVAVLAGGPLAGAQGLDLRKLATDSVGAIAPAEQQGDSPHVRAELIADRTTVYPGEPFRIGVHYTIDPDWHIYWRNSGDSGVPTRIQWHLPAGWQASPLQWPVPRRFIDSDLISYAYDKEVLLYAWIYPPADAAPGTSVTLRADSDWLVCKEICLPGEAKGLSVSVGVAAGPGTDADANQVARATRAARIPGPFLDLDKVTGTALVSSQWPPNHVDYTLQTTGTQTVLRVRATPYHLSNYQLDIARVQADSERFNLFAALPEEFEATHPTLTAADTTGLTYELPLLPRAQAVPGEYRAVVALRLPKGIGQRAPTDEWQFELLLTLNANRTLTLGEVTTPTVGTTTMMPVPPAPAGTDKKDEMDQKTEVGNTSSSATLASSLPSTQSSAPAALSFINRTEVQRPLAYWLLLALLGGLILNIMPCVLPVVSLKVLGFVKQAGESNARVLRLGLAYAAGVLASFWVLAALVILIRPDGWGFLMQEPQFVLAMTALIFALGLSLFGVFSIELGGSAVNTLDTAARREGYGGAFTSGIVTTALATPCSAPFLGPALAFAFGQPGPVIFAVFSAIGAGLALPYVLLAAKPGWLRYVPKPGLWMERFKQLMGFLMMGTVLWLLFVMAGLTSVFGLLATLAFLLVLSAAAWIFGLSQNARRAGPRRFGWALALLLIAAGYWWGPRASMDGLDTMQTASAAPPSTSSTSSTASSHTDGIDWEPFSVPRVEELAQAGELVFIDFTADWCTTCKVNELGTLASSSVREAFDRHRVRALKADWTRRDPQIAAVLAQFGARAVPLYVVIPPGRPGEAFTLPTLLKPGDVIEGLERASGLASPTGAAVKELAGGSR